MTDPDYFADLEDCQKDPCGHNDLWAVRWSDERYKERLLPEYEEYESKFKRCWRIDEKRAIDVAFASVEKTRG